MTKVPEIGNGSKVGNRTSDLPPTLTYSPNVYRKTYFFGFSK